MKNASLRPYDPIVSVYPLPLSETIAKREALNARRLGKKLPVGHPYRGLPLWVPHALARLINRSAASSRPVHVPATPPHAGARQAGMRHAG